MPERDGQGQNNFPHRVRDREQRKIDANRQGRDIWFGLGTFGIVGWSVAVPTVAATFLGVWIDSHLPSRFSWTLMLLGAGLGLGCANAWYWLQKERRSITGQGKRR